MDTKEFINVAGFLILVIGIIWNFAKSQGADKASEEAMLKEINTVNKNMNEKIDQHIADNKSTQDSTQSQMSKFWAWKDSYSEDAANRRLEIQKQIGTIEGKVAMHDTQYAHILSAMQNLEKNINTKFDKLDEKLDGLKRP